MCESDYLVHYGVLGMKWGMRRAAKSGSDYSYKSHLTKKYEKKAEKAAVKGKIDLSAKYANRAKRSSEMDAKRQKLAKDTKTRTMVARSVIATPLLAAYGTSTYHSLQAAGVSKGKAAVLSTLGLGNISSMANTVAKARYIRQDEHKATGKKKGAMTD